MSDFKIPEAGAYARNEERTARYEQALYTDAGQHAREYLASRGLTENTWRHFRLGVVVEPFAEDVPASGRLVIPNVLVAGVAALRFRRLGEGDGPKYWSPAGSGLYLFNVSSVLEATGSAIAITEGEIDCMTLWQCGIPAVGFPGAQAWKPHHRNLFDGYSAVTIPVDNDDQGAGQEFAEKVAASVRGPRVISMPPGHDINSYYNEAGQDALLSHLHLKEMSA